ncbi:MAG: mechanosensitive ion channel [Gammaproteobacteria bacterium]|nr:mechanosensitive ion channel [Gammaproteobacteria bacterium]
MNDIAQLFEYPIAKQILIASIGILLILILVQIIRSAVKKSITNQSSKYHALKFVGFFRYVAIILLLLFVFIEKVSGLAVSLGVVGAAIAFSLQEVITSIAGWLAITFGNFYKTGDRIKIGGIKGDVIDISLLRTTLFEVGDWVNGDLYNGRVVRIANSFLFKDPVFNYSGDFPFLWDEIQLPIRFESDRVKTKAIIKQATQNILKDHAKEFMPKWENLVEKYLLYNAEIEPVVTMQFDENWITYTIRYVVEFNQRRSVKNKLSEALLSSIEQSQGQVRIATASQEVTLIKP